MVKLVAALLAAWTLGACAPAAPLDAADAGESVQRSSCPTGLQRCSRYSGQPGECYDPFRASCHSGQVCALGQQLCVKDGLTFCHDPKRQRC